ncbi:hypothetical protein [Pectobacterium zantedeschiae]|uniref:hypothetical protein n=1 Tax=Pectobacterium zantedeschiae TaxID=2034769 RepID=UPI00101D0CC4|nr:hypothetical protein [Pectobacterium zantedeschiae]RYC43112.1 hypothetical protein DEH81_11320 [Pectobacterium zantedeschiae]
MKVPVQKPSSTQIDEEYSRGAYKEYSAQGHGSQSFEFVHARGGFCYMELVVLLYQRIKRLEAGGKQGITASIH